MENTNIESTGINIQVNTLIRALMESEPCLFFNKQENLMVNSLSDTETRLYPFRGEHPPIVNR